MSMPWVESHRADPMTRFIADRHYNRQKIGAPQFVPPGRCYVLRTINYDAFWVTSWPFAQYVKHAWGGAWICSAFRNESKNYLASELIRTAVSATRWFWPNIPEKGLITFIDRTKVKSIKVHGKETWGRTFMLAGFKHIGETKGGLLVFQMQQQDIPFAKPAIKP